MITVSMIAAAFAFSSAARDITEKSTDDCMFRLAGRSVLSEYLIPLKNDYGIFAFRGNEEEICEKMKFYLERSAGGKAAEKSILADTKEYRLTNPDAFEKEILAAARFSLAEDVLDAGGTLIRKKEKSGRKPRNDVRVNVAEEGEEPGGPGREISQTGRKIKNKVIIKGLPSAGITSGGPDISALVSQGLPSVEEIFKTQSDKFLVNKYIMQNFKNRKNIEIPTNTYFQNEAEYILYGKLSDDENASAFLSDFVIMRTALNLAHIYSDPKKVRELVAMAELMTPGPGAVATQAVLAGTWALAEAENDKMLILEDEKVALFKTRSNWALGLDGAVNGTAGTGISGAVKPQSRGGNDYCGYLEIFLFLEDRTAKLLRMMDLIQINMKLNYDGDFLLKEYNTGFRLSASAGGDIYVYDQRYEKL
ncbi:MAG: DUF5702 domain-containing protein [Clostridia bacterium]|nr:DUF5702 domain-containing protein [Clostridia bacterium]